MATLKVGHLHLNLRCTTEAFVAEKIQKIHDEGLGACIDTRHDSSETLIQPFIKSLISLTRTALDAGFHALQAAQFHLLSNSPGKNIKLLKARLREPSPGVSFYRKRITCF